MSRHNEKEKVRYWQESFLLSLYNHEEQPRDQ